VLAQLEQHATPDPSGSSHVLHVLPKGDDLHDAIPHRTLLQALLRRRDVKLGEIVKTPLAATLPDGTLIAWAMRDAAQSVFEQQTSLRKGLQLLLDEHPQTLAIVVHGSDEERRCHAEVAVYTAWINGAKLPERKKKASGKSLEMISLWGYRAAGEFAWQRAIAEGNFLTRSLTVLPPNELTPGLYRQRVRQLADEHSFDYHEYTLDELREMGAGAFVAVAQGSADADAAIVRLRYQHAAGKETIALVGKGICFDTGGHNLKPARYMNGMHEDMNGSAVALGILVAAKHAGLPVNIDCWLALAQNHIGPHAYKQNDVVTALNGTTIEIVHTDAEGRMVLADTLNLAARDKPRMIVDFATLTGSMATALGARYSGIFSNRDDLMARAIAAGRQSGERLCGFPLDADYEPALDSSIADIKQCTLEGGADHILAARFLHRFIDDLPWLHMDLSASNCKGGLGAVTSEVNGFGVGWGLAFLSAVSN